MAPAVAPRQADCANENAASIEAESEQIAPVGCPTLFCHPVQPTHQEKRWRSDEHPKRHAKEAHASPLRLVAVNREGRALLRLTHTRGPVFVNLLGWLLAGFAAPRASKGLTYSARCAPRIYDHALSEARRHGRAGTTPAWSFQALGVSSQGCPDIPLAEGEPGSFPSAVHRSRASP